MSVSAPRVFDIMLFIAIISVDSSIKIWKCFHYPDLLGVTQICISPAIGNLDNQARVNNTSAFKWLLILFWSSRCYHIIIHTGFSTKKSSTSVDESEKKSTVKQLNQLNFCPTFAGNSLDQVKILRLKSFSVLSCFLNYPHEILRLISIIMMT